MRPPTATPEPAAPASAWPVRRGRREISVWVSSDDYVLLLLGLVLLAMSSVMIEAARVAEDNAGFV